MVRLKNVRLYDAENVPDHILEEVDNVIGKLSSVIGKLRAEHDPNILLSAFNRVHAALICELVTKESIKEATQTEAIGLMKNVQHISGIQIWKEKK